jgi:hypothetical protein
MDCIDDGVLVGRILDPSGETSRPVATFAGAKPCRQRTCPVCGPKIALAHRDDIRLVHGQARAVGVTVRFVTLTIRHGKSDALADLLDALLACYRGLTTGREWSEARRRYGLLGTIRVLECKHGDEHGWHPHLHLLLFLRPPLDAGDAAISDLYALLLTRWKRLTAAAGYGASVEAQDMREVSDEHLDTIAGYLTKEHADRIADEMTGDRWKTRGTSRGPHALLVAAAAGDLESARLFREYELASAGRRLYAAASHALRAAVAAPPEPNEKWAAAEPEPLVRDRLVMIGRGSWGTFARHRGWRADLAEAAVAAEDGYEVLDFLQRRGIAARLSAGAPPSRPAGILPDDVEAVF